MPVSDKSRFAHCLPANPESIGALRRGVVDYAACGGASKRRREDIALAVSEALSNVVLHAYDGSDDAGEVRVDAWLDGAALQVAVRDDGNGITTRSDSPGLGLGVGLMSQLTDALRLESGGPGHGMRVRMTFALD